MTIPNGDYFPFIVKPLPYPGTSPLWQIVGNLIPATITIPIFNVRKLATRNNPQRIDNSTLVALFQIAATNARIRGRRIFGAVVNDG
jgi:hypothetical protein